MTEVGQDSDGDEWDDWDDDPAAIADCAVGAGVILQTTRKGVTFGHGRDGLRAADIDAPELAQEFNRLIGLWQAGQDSVQVLNGEPSVTCVVDQARGIFIIANERQFTDTGPRTPVHAAALVVAQMKGVEF